MTVRGLLLLTAVSLPLADAAAVDFLELRATATEHIYVDRETIQARDGRATAWSLWDLHEPQGNSYDESYRSVLIKNEYDCQRRTVRVVEVKEFAGPMAQGQALRSYTDYAKKPDTLPAGSVGETIFEMACPRVSAGEF